jgi:oligo-1,6-glucosidase
LLSNAGRRKLADADHITLESLETAVVLLKA